MFIPQFTITNKILTCVGMIEACREALEVLPLSSEWIEKLRIDALVRSVFFNSQLDGSKLTMQSCERIVKEEPERDESPEEVASRLSVVGREKDIQSVMNYRNAIRYVDQLARLGKKTGTSFSEKECFQIHSLLMERILPSNLLGIYRMGQVEPSVGGEFGSAPLAVEVPYQMQDFWFFLKNFSTRDIHPVLLAGISAFELERIRPFAGGNDGVMRMIGNLILSTNGYDNKRFICFAQNVHGKDLAAFLESYCEALAIEMGKIKDKVIRLSGENETSLPLGKQVYLPERQTALLETLKMKDELTMSGARMILPTVSDDTILRDLSALVAKKLVKKKGNTKGARYVLR